MFYIHLELLKNYPLGGLALPWNTCYRRSYCIVDSTYRVWFTDKDATKIQLASIRSIDKSYQTYEGKLGNLCKT